MTNPETHNTPAPFLRKLFPQSTASFAGRSGKEVNGLPQNTVPQGCEILAEGTHNSSILGRQTYYLVEVDGVQVYLRVCTAHEDSDYDEFAVILEVQDNAEHQAEFSSRVRESIEAICSLG